MKITRTLRLFPRMAVLASLLLLPFAAPSQDRSTGFSLLSANGNNAPLSPEAGTMQTQGSGMLKAMAGYARGRTSLLLTVPLGLKAQSAIFADDFEVQVWARAAAAVAELANVLAGDDVVADEHQKLRQM